VDAAGQRAELVTGGFKLARQHVEQIEVAKVRRSLRPSARDGHADLDEATLCTIVQKSGEAPALLVTGLYDPPARGAQLSELGCHLRLEAPVGEQQFGCLSHCVRQGRVLE